MNASECMKVENELKKLKIYEYFHEEWSRTFYQFILEWTDGYQLDEKLLNNLMASENISLSLVKELLPYSKRNCAYSNPNLTLDFIKEHRDLPWDFINISQFTKKITFDEMFEFYKHRHEYNIKGSESITLEFMHDLDMDTYMNLVDTYKGYHWSCESLQYNTTITMKDYLKYRHHPFFTQVKTVMVNDHPYRIRFDASYLRTLTVDDYLNNDDYPWNEVKMRSHTSQFTYEDYLRVGFVLPGEPVEDLHCINEPRFDYLVKYPQHPWYKYWSFVKSPLVTMNHVIQNSHLSWNYDDLLSNPNMTFDYLRKNKEMFLERNQGMAFYEDVFCMNVIRNPFTTERIHFILQRITRNIIHSNIYFELKAITWNPSRPHYQEWCGVLCEE